MIMPVLTSADLMPLLPEIVVVLGAFALLMLDLFVDERRRFLVHAGGIAVLGVATAMIATGVGGQGTVLNGMFVRDIAADVMKVAIGVVSWTGTARLARGEFLRLKRREYVLAERVIGASDARIIWKVILPNALAPLIVSATLAIGTAILFEAGLSFLGLGDPNVMSWGLMIGSNRPYILTAWWAVTLPGAAIFLTVLAVSLIGDGLNGALNPNSRGRA